MPTKNVTIFFGAIVIVSVILFSSFIPIFEAQVIEYYNETVPYEISVPYNVTVPYEVTFQYNETVPYDVEVEYIETVPYDVEVPYLVWIKNHTLMDYDTRILLDPSYTIVTILTS